MPRPRKNPEKADLPYGSKAVYGTTMTTGAAHVRSGRYFDTPERPYLHDYEAVYRNDPYVRRCIDYVVDTILGSLGPYVHDDPRAVAYVNELDYRMDGTLKEALGRQMATSLWAGFAVSEMVLYSEDNRIWLKKLAEYHPMSLYLIPNGRGELVENESIPAHPFLPKSGVWQRYPLSGTHKPPGSAKKMVDYVQLPMRKLVFTRYGERHGNFMGESILAPVWKRIEMVYETWKNLMITTERYGSPQVAVIVPRANTSEQMQDGQGGTTYKSLAQKTAEQMSQLSVANGIVVEEPIGLPGDPKVRFQNISSFNNFAEAFHQTIEKLYRDIMVGMGVPPLLYLENSSGISAGTIAKVHAETYKQLIVGLHGELVEPFMQQLIGNLLKLNFGISDPGRFVFKPFDIAAADTIMHTFGVANDQGLLDFSIEEDLVMARRMLGFDEISKETLTARLRNNRTLMTFKRDPAAHKLDVAEIRKDTSLEQTQMMTSAQKAMAQGAQATQLKIARLKAKPKPLSNEAVEGNVPRN